MSTLVALVPGIVLTIGGLFTAAPVTTDLNPDVAITPIVVTGTLGARAQQRLEADLVDEVGRPGLAVVSPAAVRAYTTESSACQTAECTAALGRQLGVEHVMRVALAVDAREYELSIRVLSVLDGDEIVHESAHCEICGLDEVADELVALAGRATAVIPPPTVGAVFASLNITSDPIGAAAFVDGQAVGVTPTTVEVEPGPHAVKLEKSGHITQADAIQIDDEPTRTVAYVLSPVQVVAEPVARPPKPERTRNPRVRLLPPIGWALTGSGVASIATGAALIATDAQPVQGSCADGARQSDQQCSSGYGTKTAGTALLTVGLTGLGVGLTLAIVATRWQHDVNGTTAAGSRQRRRLTAAPGGVRLRF